MGPAGGLQPLGSRYGARLLVVSILCATVIPRLTRRHPSRSSLKNHGVDCEVSGMFDVGAETLDLPLEEKMRYEQGDNGDSFG